MSPGSSSRSVARGQTCAISAPGSEARELGLRTLRLETNRTLREVISLYISHGYREVPAFNADPYADHWFQKQLD